MWYDKGILRYGLSNWIYLKTEETRGTKINLNYCKILRCKNIIERIERD